MSHSTTRRRFLQDTALSASGVAIGQVAAAADTSPVESFASDWQNTPDRPWLGPQYWSNPLQDWRINRGRLECINPAPGRNVHLLTYELTDTDAAFTARVRIGTLNGAAFADQKGSAGFSVGVRGPIDDYRSHVVAGTGFDAGFDCEGVLFVGDKRAVSGKLNLTEVRTIDLILQVQPEGSAFKVTLTAINAATDQALATIAQQQVPAERFVGNLSLVANFADMTGDGRKGRRNPALAATRANGTFWFADWTLKGTKLAHRADRAFGPLLFNHYTLSEGVLKMTVQLPPLGNQRPTVYLQRGHGGNWVNVGESEVHAESCTAHFRGESWDDSQDHRYRVACTLTQNDGTAQTYLLHGTIRRDPIEKPEISVANISCNSHYAFPNPYYVNSLATLDPDLLAFTGDQFYESSGGFHIQREPLGPALLDVLRKWYLHGWTWRKLTCDRPSVCLPDDHDVYHGNLWGEAGAATQGTLESGGYLMPAAWVNAVHRFQTSHHPDPYESEPGRQGITNYYGPMTYGRISFAILADRQYKSGPEGKVPPSGSARGDHVTDPNFDPKLADVPGLQLLGDKQMEFLRTWAADWRHADMKAVISQTIFTAMATTHGGTRMRLRADYDANGWPQTARHQALREIRRAFAFHLAGDQHLGAVVHYGIDHHGDAGVAFAGPAVNSVYPRWFEPEKPGENRLPGAPENTGEFVDSFDNPMTVLAVANPKVGFRSLPLQAEVDKACGLGIVRFDKPKRQIVIECWPYMAAVGAAETQFAGWPLTIDMLKNYARSPVAYLPTLTVRGVDSPVLQVIDQQSSEVVYTLRIAGNRFRPHVFAEGKYTVVVSEPESGRMQQKTDVAATAQNNSTLEITL